MKTGKNTLTELLRQRAIAYHLITRPDQSAPYWRGYLDAIDLAISISTGIKQGEISGLIEWKDIKSQGQLF